MKIEIERVSNGWVLNLGGWITTWEGIEVDTSKKVFSAKQEVFDFVEKKLRDYLEKSENASGEIDRAEQLN